MTYNDIVDVAVAFLVSVNSIVTLGLPATRQITAIVENERVAFEPSPAVKSREC